MLQTILTTVAVIAGINGGLALILVLAERFFANYGTKTITINGEKELEVEGGATLLSALKSQKIFLPSACGGRGTCAYCKCQVTEGAGPLLPTEEPLLTRDEVADQVRLSCQVKVKDDLQIRIPEALFNIKEFRAKTVLIEDLTHDIKRVRFQLMNPPEIRFASGQYVQLQTPRYGKVKESVSRAYSIASSNAETGSIDLMIRLVPEGICTTWVHEYLKEGDEVTFTGPMGDFMLQPGEGEMVLLAGGSGMAPMVSLLHELERTQDPRPITYFFGAVSRRDLFFIDEMRRFEDALPNFKFIPALSRPCPEDEWEGVSGLITVPLAEHLASMETGNAQAYLCGSPGLLNASIAILKEHGVTDERIFYDPFS